MPEDPALRFISEQVAEVKADGKETRALVQELASRDRADLLRFDHHDKRISRLETGLLWAIGVVLVAVIGAVLNGVQL